MALLDTLNLNYLRIFMAVYRTGSMTQAARELHLTQSGISQQIKSLEENLGITLFDRINRRIIPTNEAEILFTECSKHVENLEYALQRISTQKRELTGQVKIGFPPVFGHHILLPLVADFSRRFPSVRYELRMGLASEITSLLLDGRLDFAFVDSFARDPHLITEEVAEEKLELCCHREILERYHPYKFTAAFFRQLPFVAYVKGEPVIRSWFQHNFRNVPHELNVIATVIDSNAVCKIISERMGAGLVPQTLVGELTREGENIHVFEGKSVITNKIYVSSLARRSMGQAAAKCYDSLKKSLLDADIH